MHSPQIGSVIMQALPGNYGSKLNHLRSVTNTHLENTEQILLETGFQNTNDRSWKTIYHGEYLHRTNHTHTHIYIYICTCIANYLFIETPISKVLSMFIWLNHSGFLFKTNCNKRKVAQLIQALYCLLNVSNNQQIIITSVQWQYQTPTLNYMWVAVLYKHIY